MPKNVIHECLKNSKCTNQTKGHDDVLIVPMVSVEGSLVDVFKSHMNLMRFGFEVKFGEDQHVIQFLE